MGTASFEAGGGLFSARCNGILRSRGDERFRLKSRWLVFFGVTTLPSRVSCSHHHFHDVARLPNPNASSSHMTAFLRGGALMANYNGIR